MRASYRSSDIRADKAREVDAGGTFSPDPTEPSPAVKGMRGRYVDGRCVFWRCVFYGGRGIGLRGKVCDLNSHHSHLTPSTPR